MMAGAERGGEKGGKDKMLGFGGATRPTVGFSDPFVFLNGAGPVAKRRKRVTGRPGRRSALPATLVFSLAGWLGECSKQV